ncbi:hypothetical protein LNJ08_11915 [Tenacibaculum finnmarkense genomovar ulcerans]|uniref:RHS repeat domain-containing protein n=1 Tax=Tenacibaculum finnmarkense TaxID=2781243 RepID=UPI001E2B7DD7|nr:RHS repeat-associated core domain-containing protein [Tenacibaculum finnmarkense]MCD8455096.1 hypothetical protein [Tenacibaculum finnmarkense genomovar ulcerans]
MPADHLGTPTSMHNEEGETTWERSLDSNGKVREGDNSSCPFLFQGQYYDAEIELAYNRFRYYDPEDGRYISVDPIGLLSGEFAFYGYVTNPNAWVDVFGLVTHSVYALKRKGEVVYIGITMRDPKKRKQEHKNGSKKVKKKDFDEMVVIAEVDSYRGSRDIEGSALHQAHENGTTLDNKTRPVSEGYYHSYDPDNLPSNKTYIDNVDINAPGKVIN